MRIWKSSCSNRLFLVAVVVSSFYLSWGVPTRIITKSIFMNMNIYAEYIYIYGSEILQKNIYQLKFILLSIQTRICDYMQIFSNMGQSINHVIRVANNIWKFMNSIRHIAETHIKILRFYTPDCWNQIPTHKATEGA